MKKRKIKLLCYSKADFERVMTQKMKEWHADGCLLPDKAIISILDADAEPSDHMFMNGDDRVLNLEFSDCDPNEWWSESRYDELFTDYCDNGYNEWQKPDDGKFSHYDSEHGIYYYAMSCGDADMTVTFINDVLDDETVDEIYVHCIAGNSRSQGVVRYIIDMYPDIEFVTRPDNPNDTPNWHVVSMLKRAHDLFL